MPLDRVKANELLELVVIDQSPKARELLLDKLEQCVTGVALNTEQAALTFNVVSWIGGGKMPPKPIKDTELFDLLKVLRPAT